MTIPIPQGTNGSLDPSTCDPWYWYTPVWQRSGEVCDFFYNPFRDADEDVSVLYLDWALGDFPAFKVEN